MPRVCSSSASASLRKKESVTIEGGVVNETTPGDEGQPQDRGAKSRCVTDAGATRFEQTLHRTCRHSCVSVLVRAHCVLLTHMSDGVRLRVVAYTNVSAYECMKV